MQLINAAAALAILASTAAAQDLPSVFGVMALHSGSPVHFQMINANGGDLWIGKSSATSCPKALNNTCPDGSETLFTGPSQYGTLSLDVVVPGGQQVYIEPSCGKVKFTQAHSGYMPMGSNGTGWTLMDSGVLDYLSWPGGTVFCPMGEGIDPFTGYPNGPWQLYVKLRNVSLPDGCLGATLLATNATGPGAWQYM